MPASGTTQPGDRLVLITEELFLDMVEELAEHQGREFDIDWGDAHFSTHTYFSPTIYVAGEGEEAAPEPTS